MQALEDSFHSPTPTDRVLERLFKANPKWGSRDRAFVASAVYEVVRHYRFLYEILGKEPDNQADWQAMIGIWLRLQKIDLPDWLKDSRIAKCESRAFVQQLAITRTIRESIPDWLDEVAVAELGEKWTPLIASLNQPAELVIRVNTLIASRKKVAQYLKSESIETEEIGREGLVLSRRANVFRLKGFLDGWFEVQDAASQEVARAVAPRPGQLVVDACAGAGGKTLHLAALMENQGRIIALDTGEKKLFELKRRARRAGAHTIETRYIENMKVVKRLYGTADAVLIDAPCSGLGVLRRNPDTKWKMKPAFLDKVRETQEDILQKYSPMCKPGGRLVYATCSILPSENEDQVSNFLSNNPEFELESQRNLTPEEFGFDGFFIATMKRKVEIV